MRPDGDDGAIAGEAVAQAPRAWRRALFIGRLPAAIGASVADRRCAGPRRAKIATTSRPISSWASTVWAPMCGVRMTFGRSASGDRLPSPSATWTSSAAPRSGPSGPSASSESRLVDDAAAGDVDEERSGLDLRQLARHRSGRASARSAACGREMKSAARENVLHRRQVGYPRPRSASCALVARMLDDPDGVHAPGLSELGDARCRSTRGRRSRASCRAGCSRRARTWSSAPRAGCRSARTTWRASAIISPNVSSATAWAPGPGMRTSSMPRSRTVCQVEVVEPGARADEQPQVGRREDARPDRHAAAEDDRLAVRRGRGERVLGRADERGGRHGRPAAWLERGRGDLAGDEDAGHAAPGLVEAPCIVRAGRARRRRSATMRRVMSAMTSSSGAIGVDDLRRRQDVGERQVAGRGARPHPRASSSARRAWRTSDGASSRRTRSGFGYQRRRKVPWMRTSSGGRRGGRARQRSSSSRRRSRGPGWRPPRGAGCAGRGPSDTAPRRSSS